MSPAKVIVRLDVFSSDFICGGAGSVSAWLSSESLLLAQEKKIAVKRMKLRVWRINFLFTATPDF